MTKGCPNEYWAEATNTYLPVFSENYGLVLIITSEAELEISGHVVQRF